MVKPGKSTRLNVRTLAIVAVSRKLPRHSSIQIGRLRGDAVENLFSFNEWICMSKMTWGKIRLTGKGLKYKGVILGYDGSGWWWLSEAVDTVTDAVTREKVTLRVSTMRSITIDLTEFLADILTLPISFGGF